MNPYQNTGKAAPIGIFDAGPGGLAVLKYMMEILPAENVLYLGDTARQPYGPQPVDKVRGYTIEACRYLVQQGVKAILIGCNTASVAGLDEGHKTFTEVPILGMIEPGVRAALRSGDARNIGVWGTELTVESHAYRDAIQQAAADKAVLEVACSDLLRLAELGQIQDKPLITGLVRRYLEPFDAIGMDTLIFGCTDLTCVRPETEQAAGAGVRIIDPAEEIVQDIREILGSQSLLNEQSPADRAYDICITGENTQAFSSFAEAFLGLKSVHVRQVTIT